MNDVAGVVEGSVFNIFGFSIETSIGRARCVECIQK